MSASSCLRTLAGAQNWRCCWCGFRMIMDLNDEQEVRAVIGDGGRPKHRAKIACARAVSSGHVKPRSEGGKSSAGNLAAACVCCNIYRQTHPFEAAAPRINRMLRRGTHPHQVWERQRIYSAINPLLLRPKKVGTRKRPAPPAAVEMGISAIS